MCTYLAVKALTLHLILTILPVKGHCFNSGYASVFGLG